MQTSSQRRFRIVTASAVTILLAVGMIGAAFAAPEHPAVTYHGHAGKYLTDNPAVAAERIAASLEVNGFKVAREELEAALEAGPGFQCREAENVDGGYWQSVCQVEISLPDMEVKTRVGVLIEETPDRLGRPVPGPVVGLGADPQPEVRPR